MKDYKLYIFDLDGTLLDTLEDLADAANYALVSDGLPPRSIEEIRNFVGNGIRKLIERAVPEGTLPELTDKVFSVFDSYYAEHYCVKTKPYEGIYELLDRLKKRGAKIAVSSNKPDYAVKLLCDKFFAEYADLAFGERVGIARKPAPDSVSEILRHFAISPEDAVYIGDSEVDIQTAENAGLDCISVSWGFKDREFLETFGAKRIVDRAEEI